MGPSEIISGGTNAKKNKKSSQKLWRWSLKKQGFWKRFDIIRVKGWVSGLTLYSKTVKPLLSNKWYGRWVFKNDHKHPYVIFEQSCTVFPPNFQNCTYLLKSLSRALHLIPILTFRFLAFLMHRIFYSWIKDVVP